MHKSRWGQRQLVGKGEEGSHPENKSSVKVEAAPLSQGMGGNLSIDTRYGVDRIGNT